MILNKMMEEENHGQNGESSVVESKKPSAKVSNDAVFAGKQLLVLILN